MLRLERISKIYPGNEVLRDVTWEVKAGDRIGLVGANGAGKSTQMKIAAGQIEPTTGDVIRPASLNIVYLNQEFEVDPTRTISAGKVNLVLPPTSMEFFAIKVDDYRK